MAAHPFGPIENQLIVGYYKRGFSPAKVKPILEFTQTHRILDEKSHPDHHFTKPFFYGWSPANGNSSSHDFRVTWKGEGAEMRDLLSRGLGYRITFTMPEQEIRTEDPTSLPRVELEILDPTGKRISPIIHVDTKEYFGSRESSLKEHLQSFKVLRFENTLLHLLIVENETDEYLFPVYSPPGSSIDERHLAAAERHQEWLGQCYRDQSDMISEFEKLCSKHALLLLMYLEKNHTNLSSAQKQLIKGCITGCTSGIVRGLNIVVNQPESSSPACKRLLPRMVNNLESDIRKWLDDEGPFPRYFSTAAIKACFNSYVSKPDESDGESGRKETKKLFDASAIFDPEKLQSLIDTLLQEPIERAVQHLVSSGPQHQVFLQTKKYSITSVGSNTCFFKTCEGVTQSTDLTWCWPKKLGGGSDAGYCLVDRDDTVLVYSADQHGFSRFADSASDSDTEATFALIDLDFIYRNPDIPPSPELNPGITFVGTLTLKQARIFLRHGRIVVCGIVDSQGNQGRFCLQRVCYSYLQGSKENQVDPWIDLNLAAYQVSADVLHGNEFKIHIGHTEQTLYILSYAPTSDRYSCRIWMCFGCPNPTKSQLEIVSQASFQVDTFGPIALLSWLETKKHRVFACAFTPDCRLWAFMYWKGKFVVAGAKQSGHISRPIRLGHRLTSLLLTNLPSGQRVVLVVKECNDADTGSRIYHFGPFRLSEC